MPEDEWIPLVQDDEVGAIAKVVDALASLDTPARVRVLKWAEERFGSMGDILKGFSDLTDQQDAEIKRLRAELEDIELEKAGRK